MFSFSVLLKFGVDPANGVVKARDLVAAVFINVKSSVDGVLGGVRLSGIMIISMSPKRDRPYLVSRKAQIRVPLCQMVTRLGREKNVVSAVGKASLTRCNKQLRTCDFRRYLVFIY